MKGATERWVVIDGKDILANLFRTERDFYYWCWGPGANRSFTEALESKPQQRCKLFKLNRMEYAGYLLPQEKQP